MGKKTILTEDRKQEIIQYYLAPHSLGNTAREFKIGQRVLKNILAENQIALHSPETCKQLRKENSIKTCLEKYGAEYVSQSEEIKDKIKQTNIKRYGVEWTPQAKQVKEKIKQTNLERYGTTTPITTPSVKEKAKQTLIQKYGVENAFSSTEIKDKIAQTNLDRYSCTNVGQNEQIKEKIKQTNLFKYGVSCTLNTEEGKTKSRATMRAKYGYEYSMQDPDQSQQIIAKSQETKANWSTEKKEEIFQRIVNSSITTKRQNHTFNTSSAEEKFYTQLLTRFSKEDIFRQYKDERYPFCCDFYIKCLDLFIELNLTWTHGFKAFEGTEEDLSKLALWQEKAKSSKYYQNAIETWTVRDVKKQQTAKQNNLNYIVIYNEDSMRGISF